MLRSIVFYIVIAFSGLNVAFSFAAEIETTVSGQHVELLPDRQGNVLFTGENLSWLSSTGEPNIPYTVKTVLLPPDADFSSMTVSLAHKQLTPVAGEWDLPPVPGLAAKVEGKLLTADRYKNLRGGYDLSIYEKNIPFPRRLVGDVRGGDLRKYRLAHIPVALFQYTPVEKKLYRLDRARIVIRFDRKPSIKTSAAAFDPVADKWIQGKTDNYADMKSEYASMTLRQVTPQGGTGYVIMTTSAIATGSSELAAFVASKQARGFKVSVVTEEEWGGGTGDDAAENVREWLKNNYVQKNIEYVLLIGNPDPDNGDLAMKRLWPRNNQSFYTQYKDSPSDYYFADLTGNWDKDNDGKYGEAGTSHDFAPGGVDLNHDVIVGRIPFYGKMADLDKILAKITAYENETRSSVNWRKKVLLPMEPSDSRTPGYHLGEQIKDGIVTPMGDWDSYRIYDLDFNVGPEQTPCTIDNVSHAWQSSGYGAVFWWTHGSSTIASDVMNAYTAGTLDDRLPAFTFQCSCHNANPDATGNLAYSLLKNGAIATIGATRVSWYYRGQTYFDGSPSNAGLTYEYAQRLINDEMTCGYALYDVKQSVKFFNDAELWMNFTDFNIYGDPSIGITTCRTSELLLPAMTVTQSGVPVPASTGSYNFGNAGPSGGTADAVFAVNNSGSAELMLNGSPAVQISGEQADHFAVVSQPAAQVSPGGRENFKIEFVPGEAGDYSAVVSIANNDVAKNPYEFTVTGTVSAQGTDQLTIDSVAFPDGAVGSDYNVRCRVSGGTPPFHYTVSSGQLPAGLTLTGGGQISGTPSAAGDFVFTIKVTDSGGPPSGAEKTFTISIKPASGVDEEFTTGSLDGYTVDIPKPGPEISAATVPGHVRFTVPDEEKYDHWRNINNAPQLRRSICPGDWTLETKAKCVNTTGGRFHTGLMVYFSHLDLYYWGFNGNTNTLKLSRTGKGNLVREKYQGGDSVELRIRREDNDLYFDYREPGKETWIEAGTRTITGVPQEFGLIAKTWGEQQLTVDFDYLRVNGNGPVEELVILTENLPDGSSGAGYNTRLEASGGIPPYSWTLAGGTFVPGLTLHENGTISGTPAAQGLFEFTVGVSCTRKQTSRNLSIKVTGSPGIDEEFSTGSLEGYTAYIPKAGPAFDLESRPGFLRVNIPRKWTYDHWDNVDKAPQLRRELDQPDWTAETRVRVVKAVSPQYHAGLMVFLSRYDIIYWGFSGGTSTLKMSRSGDADILAAEYQGGDEVELRIVKEGITYTFQYRRVGTDTWLDAGEYKDASKPAHIGLIGKIWTKMEFVADFDYLRMTCGVSMISSARAGDADLQDDAVVLPDRFDVSQAYPNPFNPSTRVNISLAAPSDVTVTVYNIRGQIVRNLYRGHRPGGIFNVDWNAQDNSGVRLQSGSYFMRVKVNRQIFYRKLLLVK